MEGVNSDLRLLCRILLSFPEVILIVLDISAKDKSKDVLITPLNKFHGILSEPSSIAQFLNTEETSRPIGGI